jgi:cyclohexanone monooxygenase
VTDLIEHATGAGVTRIEATEEAATEWTGHVHEAAERMLFSRIDSWFTGVNTNQIGKQERRVLLYAGGAPRHRRRCDEVAAHDYEGFILT